MFVSFTTREGREQPQGLHVLESIIERMGLIHYLWLRRLVTDQDPSEGRLDSFASTEKSESAYGQTVIAPKDLTRIKNDTKRRWSYHTIG